MYLFLVNHIFYKIRGNYLPSRVLFFTQIIITKAYERPGLRKRKYFVLKEGKDKNLVK